MAKLEQFGFEPTPESTAYLDWRDSHEMGSKPPFDWDALGKAEDEWLENKLAENYQRQRDDIKGAVVKFQIADGYAWYLVTKLRPLTLQQVIGYSFEYSIPEAHIRGLRVKDIEDQLELERRLKLLFRKKV